MSCQKGEKTPTELPKIIRKIDTLTWALVASLIKCRFGQPSLVRILGR